MSVTQPRLSVVVAASTDVPSLVRCLSSLSDQAAETSCEVVVVSNYDDGIREAVGRQFPGVRLIALPPATTVPELRLRGICSSTGEIVALIEDHCVLDRNWCSEIWKAHQGSHAIVGGSVEKATRNGLLDWAVYFHEYGKYMLPGRPGEVDSLPGNNVTYKRAMLKKIEGSFSSGFFETFVHWQLRQRGVSLYLNPSAVVYHDRSYRLGPALAQCYHHGRSFAGMRVERDPIHLRVLFATGSLLLPILLPARIVTRILRKGRHLRELLLSFPYLFALMTSWAAGEFCGYAFGAGGSRARWK